MREKYRFGWMGCICIFSVCFQVQAQKAGIIHPGAAWPDQKGNPIQAHGGGIIKIGKNYYWYGEERRQGLDSNYRYVSCYSSADLVNWKFEGDVLQLSDPENLGRHWVLERPKVFYNRQTKKYVMYFHLDDARYKLARVGIAVSNTATGNFKYVKSFRPLGHESRDIGQFIDDDGAAYLVFEDRPNGFHIAKLSADYMDVERDMSLIPQHMEGGAIVHYKGLYYAIGSALTGWNPNPNKYAIAKKLEGPWSPFEDIAPPAVKTYGAQSTMLLKITGSKTTTVLFMGDQWKPKAQWDSRYLWMPLEIGNGKLWLPEPRSFSLNVKTGEAVLQKDRE
ncbi:ricin B lectin [Niabella soli DSM 19437]|uniref:Ricin B lectin n=2 Tax=Niabella TaxID=379899 RepID=W0EZG8_9BACT|nr:ricin B lectin [Niabella soli DSM 19437]